MPPARRLDPALYRFPTDEIRRGYYSDVYFNRARAILQTDGRDVRVRMQVFQRSGAVLCGIDEALTLLRVGTGRFDGAERWRDRAGRASRRRRSSRNTSTPPSASSRPASTSSSSATYASDSTTPASAT